MYLTPFIHQDLGISRKLRILGWTGQLDTGGPTAPGDAALANARDAMLTWLASTFDLNPTYVEFSDAAGSVAPLSNNLPGYDVLVVYDQHFVFDTQEPDQYLVAVASAWNGSGTLGNFLDAGGVVVVLAGSIEGPRG